ncbi:unnamed protein product [Sphagnum tenellum]
MEEFIKTTEGHKWLYGGQSLSLYGHKSGYENAASNPLRKGHLEVIQFLAKHNPKSILSAKDSIHDSYHSGINAIDMAMLNGHQEVLEFLMGSFPELLKEKNGWKDTVAHRAANEQCGLCLFVLKNIANQDPQQLEVKNLNHRTPTGIAAINHRWDSVKVLAEYAPQSFLAPSSQYGSTPVALILQERDEGYEDVLKFLAAHGISIPLHHFTHPFEEVLKGQLERLGELSKNKNESSAKKEIVKILETSYSDSAKKVDPQTFIALAHALSDSDSKVSIDAAHTLGKELHHRLNLKLHRLPEIINILPQIREALFDALSDSRPEVRWAAAEAFQEVFGNEKGLTGIPELRRVLYGDERLPPSL